MERRRLAEGIEVSALGLGTVKLGRDRGVKYPDAFTIPDDEQAQRLLATAEDLGINLIDTAPAYGTSEERLGRLLAGRRDRWVIATKVGETFDAEAGSSFDFSPEAVRRSIERSLQRLRTDRVDVVLIHSDGTDERILNELGTLEALREVQRAGLVRAVGMSSKTAEGAMLAVERCDVVMLTLNERERDDLPAIRAAHAKGVGVLIKKALASGHAASGDSGHPDEAGDPVDRAMRLCLGEPAVSSVVVGTINPQHLRANAAAAERACEAARAGRATR